MHNSAAIMLVDKETVRPVRVEYDPNLTKNNNYHLLFKTIDKDLKKGDYVVVQTDTRHNLTVVKVLEVGFAVDFDKEYKWIVQRVDTDAFEQITKTEDQIVGKVQEAQENKLRREIMDNLGVHVGEFDGLMNALKPQQTAIPAPPAPEPYPDGRTRGSAPPIEGGYTGRTQDDITF